MSAVTMTEGWRTLIAETPPLSEEALEERQKRHEQMLAEAATAGAERYQAELDAMIVALRASKMGLAPLPKRESSLMTAALSALSAATATLAVATTAIIAGPTIAEVAEKAYRWWTGWRPPVVNIDINPDFSGVVGFTKAIVRVASEIAEFAVTYPHILVAIVGIAVIGGLGGLALFYLFRIDDRK